MNTWVFPVSIEGDDGETIIFVKTGTGLDTVTVAVLLMVPLDTVIIVVPDEMAVNKPLLSIIPTPGSLLVHVTVDCICLPNWSFDTEKNLRVWPAETDRVNGDNIISVNLG